MGVDMGGVTGYQAHTHQRGLYGDAHAFFEAMGCCCALGKVALGEGLLDVQGVMERVLQNKV